MIKYKLLGIHCDDMRFRLNLVKADAQAKFEVKPEFNRTVKKNPEVPKRRIIEFTVKMVGTEENPLPFDLGIKLSTMFELEDEIWLVEDEQEFVDSATAFAFPYLRTAMTNLTTAAMINPIILPPIDPVPLFRRGAQNNPNQQ